MTVATDVNEVVQVSTDIMSGAPVFRGTRVPVRTLLDHLEAGDSLEKFLNDFPTVTKEQAVQFLEVAGEAALQKVGEGHS